MAPRRWRPARPRSIIDTQSCMVPPLNRSPLLAGGPSFAGLDKAAMRWHVGCLACLLASTLYVKLLGSGTSCQDFILWVSILTLLAVVLQASPKYFKYRTFCCILMRLLFGVLHCPNLAVCELKREGIGTAWPMRFMSHVLTASGWSSVVWYSALFPLPFRYHAVTVVLMMGLCLPTCSR